MNNQQKSTYEDKVKRLDAILEQLDNSDTPIDKLADNVIEGTRLIKELSKKLSDVETKVLDAFNELDRDEE